MALSIKTQKADRLARKLAARTGESLTQAITRAIEERLERIDDADAAEDDYVARVMAAAAEFRKNYDFSKPITKEEWDEACGDTPEELGF